VALIQSPHFQADTKASYAIALSLTAALTSAIAMLGLHRLKGVHPWAIVVHYSGVATLIVLASCVLDPPHVQDAIGEPKTLLLLLGVGVAATVGQLCITRAFTSGAPARISVVGLMQIVFALGLDLLFAGASIRPITLAGIALVLAPTAWMMSGQSRQARPLSRSKAVAPRRQAQRGSPLQAGELAPQSGAR
jgi:drug/metabolite transporter (DMT)-like permease